MINVILIILLFYFPSLNISYINVSPDFFLIILIINSSFLNEYKFLFLGLLIGLFHDFLTQTNYLGFITLIYVLCSYFLLKIKVYKTLKIYQLLIFLLILLCSFSKYTLLYSETYLFYFKFSLIQSIFTYFILFLIKILFSERFKKLD